MHKIQLSQDTLTNAQKWRREIHMNPELGYDVHETAKKVATLLNEFGCEQVVTGVGKTGVVGILHGKTNASGRTVGLRADMDALPIEEQTNLVYASKITGKMHACGHDGHTAMLLGAAKHLSQTRDFDGKVVFIFQPAEEGGAGGKAMVDDGMMDTFGINEVYGMHNQPNMPVGNFGIREGALLAAADEFEIIIEGKGGHAAKPHNCVDTVYVAAQVINALQGIVSRNVDPLKSAVISVCSLHAGHAFNVIPQTCTLLGTARTLEGAVQEYVEKRIHEVADLVARAHGATANVRYDRGYPVTWNHPVETGHMVKAARAVSGETQVNADLAPSMGGEDFSYMLQARPGAMIWIGNGPSAGLHHPAYDFNDEILPFGIEFWSTLVQQRLKAA